MKGKVILTLAVIAIVAGAGFIVFGKSLFSKVENRPSNEVVSGFPDDIPVNGTKLLAEHNIFLVNNGKGIYAVSNKCTHLQCPVDWREKEKDFHCNCHGSVFKSDGTVVEPPADKPLSHYAIKFDKKVGLIVDVNQATQDESLWWQEPYFYSLESAKK